MRVVCKTVPPIQEVTIQGAVGGWRSIMTSISIISRESEIYVGTPVFMKCFHKRGIAETMPLHVQLLCFRLEAGSEEAEQLRFVNHLHALDIVAVFEQGNNTVSHNIQV